MTGDKCQMRRHPIFYVVMFILKKASVTLEKILDEIEHGNSSKGAANKEPIISSQSHNKESSREWEEKISALEKDLAEKERLIILKEEGNKELKKK
ncbi:unnamed protein product [Rhizophagus irregularis]|nr:unnamed protein product [Rhizophagus irregularis]